MRGEERGEEGDEVMGRQSGQQHSTRQRRGGRPSCRVKRSDDTGTKVVLTKML